MNEQFVLKNRKAYFQYQILETKEAGIVLQGTEIKSIRNKQVDFTDAYCQIIDNNLELLNLRISAYRYGNQFNHQVDRRRRLLLHRSEINRLDRQVRQKGLTIIPLRIYLKRQQAKVLIGIAKGRKQHDKKKYIALRQKAHSDAQEE